MKRDIEIVPVPGNKNLVEVIMREGVRLRVDKKNRVFVKFIMMLLHYGGEAAIYFAPLLGFTDRAFHNIKEAFKEKGVKALFHGNHGKKNARKITDEHIGKILTLLIQNPGDSNRMIAEKFNKQENVQISFRSVERLRNQYKLLKKKK